VGVWKFSGGFFARGESAHNWSAAARLHAKHSWTFLVDGSTLYLAVASVFVAQAAETTLGWHMGLGQQITMMLSLMLTSKGVAAVPRASPQEAQLDLKSGDVAFAEAVAQGD
jgi:hypothetical protein